MLQGHWLEEDFKEEEHWLERHSRVLICSAGKGGGECQGQGGEKHSLHLLLSPGLQTWGLCPNPLMYLVLFRFKKCVFLANI